MTNEPTSTFAAGAARAGSAVARRAAPGAGRRACRDRDTAGVSGRERGDAAVAPLGGDLVEERAQVWRRYQPGRRRRRAGAGAPACAASSFLPDNRIQFTQSPMTLTPRSRAPGRPAAPFKRSSRVVTIAFNRASIASKAALRPARIRDISHRPRDPDAVDARRRSRGPARPPGGTPAASILPGGNRAGERIHAACGRAPTPTAATAHATNAIALARRRVLAFTAWPPAFTDIARGCARCGSPSPAQEAGQADHHR